MELNDKQKESLLKEAAAYFDGEIPIISNIKTEKIILMTANPKIILSNIFD